MKKVFKNLILLVLVVVISMGVYMTGKGYILYRTATSPIGIEDKIKKIRNDKDYVKYEDISKDFLDAIVSVEDHRFYEHNGIDIISIGRALISNIEAGKIVMGGSTITQQLAKNLFFTHEQKIERKIAEVFVVNRLEKEYTKEEILELYANVIYYGDGYYGIKQASEGYFEKEPNELTLSQGILLAGLPQAPEMDSLSKNYDEAMKRSEIVLASMIRNDVISGKEIEIMKNEYMCRAKEN